MKKIGVLLLAVSSMSVLFPGSAWADRKTSLQSNRLIKDADDVFAYPHLARDYHNMVSLDYALSGSGSGLFLIKGKQATWGFALQRGSLFDVTSLTGQQELSALGDVGNPGIGTVTPTGVTPTGAFDLFFAGKNVGLRLNAGLDREFQAATTDTTDIMKQARFLNLALGVDLADEWEAAFHLGAANFNQQEDQSTTQRTNQFRGTALVRNYFERSPTHDVGMFLRAGYVFQSAEPSSTADPVNSGRLNLGVGVGPRVKVNQKIEVAAYGVVDYQNISVTSGDTKVSAHNVLLPGFNVAAEASPRPWLRVRGGMEYVLDAASVGESFRVTRYDSSLNWSGGVGFVHNDLDVNLTLATGAPLGVTPAVEETPTTTDPTDMTGADAEEITAGLFDNIGPSLMISTTYRFGPSRYHSMTASEDDEELRGSPPEPSETKSNIPVERPPQGDVQGRLPQGGEQRTGGVPTRRIQLPNPMQEGDEEEVEETSEETEESATDKAPRKKSGTMGTPPPSKRPDSAITF